MSNDNGSETSPNQTTLANILGGLLCDAARAQDISNWYSYNKLAPQYLAHIDSFNVPVPNGFLREIELDLQLSMEQVLADPGDARQRRSDLLSILSGPLYQYVASHSDQIAEAVTQLGVDRAADIARALHAPSVREYFFNALKTALTDAIRLSSDPAALVELTPQRNKAAQFLFDSIDGAFEQAALRWLKQQQNGTDWQGQLAFFARDGRKRFPDFLLDRFEDFRSHIDMALGAMQQPTIEAIFGDSIAGSKATVRIKIEQRDLQWLVYLSDPDGSGGTTQRARLGLEGS